MRQVRVQVAVALVGLVAVLAWPAGAQSEGDSRIGDSLDPSLASVNVSQRTFGETSVEALVVGRNDVFADNLGGSALAGWVGGPLLLTDGGPAAPLRPEVRDELNRVLAPNDGPNCDDAPIDVYILGGTNAVSPVAEEEIRIQGWCTERLAGDSRVETSVQVAQAIEGLTPENVEALVARDDSFADSASGGAYAGRFGYPILVTQGDSLHPAVQDYLFARDITFFDRVRLLGGTAALSQAVEDELRAIAPDPDSISRVAGSTREGTAVAIADLYAQSAGNTLIAASIANGYSEDAWVYALTGGAVGQLYSAPMLYVQTDFVPEDTYSYLFETQPESIVTVGPVERVAESTSADARAIADRQVD